MQTTFMKIFFLKTLMLALIWGGTVYAQDALLEDSSGNMEIDSSRLDDTTANDAIDTLYTFREDWAQLQRQSLKVKRELDLLKRDTAAVDTAAIAGVDGSLRKGLAAKRMELDSLRSVLTYLKSEEAFSNDRIFQNEGSDLDTIYSGGLMSREARIDSLLRMDRFLTFLNNEVVALGDSLSSSEEALGQDSAVSAQQISADPYRHFMGRARKKIGEDPSFELFFDSGKLGARILLLLLGIGYFLLQLRLGASIVEGVAQQEDKWYVYKGLPIWIPLLKTVFLIGVLLPLFSVFVPSIVLEVLGFLLLSALLAILRNYFNFEKLYWLVAVGVVYVLFFFSNLIISTELWARAVHGGVSILALVLVWRLAARPKEEISLFQLSAVQKWVTLLLFSLSLLFCVLGNIHLTVAFGTTGIVGVVWFLLLRVFKKMVLDDVDRFYQRADEGDLIRKFDINRIHLKLNRAIIFLSTVVLIFVGINTLGIAAIVIPWIQSGLMEEQKIGGATFNYAEVLIAGLVIWIANLLQKNLNSLLSPNVESVTYSSVYALFPLFRLLVMVIGFLIALSVLGIGMTNLTVIVGALSVGAGLGLQNIINNFVSGIILVFEKPFKIGDYIELADKKGRVQQIGIRSSTVMTDEGSRVIIPNGDLLSGRIVNWTFVNAQIRVNIDLKMENVKDIAGVKDQLKVLLRKNRYADPSALVQIATKDISPNMYLLSLQATVNRQRDLYRFKSVFLEEVKRSFEALEIQVTSA